MAPKKQKAQKVSLATFLGDDSLGDWADEDIDYSSISVPVQTTKSTFEPNSFESKPFESQRPQREEYPVPEVPPFKARLNNLSWDVTEDDVINHFENNLGQESFSNFYAPKEGDRLKGFAFITFNTKDLLVQALDMSGSELNGRRVYVAVAAPDRNNDRRPPREDFDWGARRGPLAAREDNDFERRPRGEPRERREEQDFDWGARKGPLAAREDNDFERRPRGEPRERREEKDFDWGARKGPLAAREDNDFERRPRGEPRERREEKDFDWGARKGPLAAREDNDFERRPRGEPRERREEKDFDWGARKGPLAAREDGDFERKPRREPREPREKREEQDFDWGARRGPLPAKEKSSGRSNSGRGGKQEDNLDWSSARTSKFVPARRSSNKPKETETKEASPAKPARSMYDVLADQNDNEEDEETEELTKKTGEVSI
ncbi:Tif3 protein [Saccharomycopsis crataegensis]|uniref:Tif3 protein n=1 Tax=Saccharomycopsis crataegensis TaxID=43959 RepID=A0AAV5QPW9_9ASCO|nr:Tif3 protein [Saccharomycopsis crataegensis]